MRKEIIISEDEYEARCAVVENGFLTEVHLERDPAQHIVGNIYKGVVDNVLPGMQIAFVEIGLEKQAFLHASDVEPDLAEEHEQESENSSKLYLDSDRPSPSRGKRGNQQPIESVIRRNQEILVQVTKSPISKKGSRVTCAISIPGRFTVYMPNAQNIGISRRIEEEAERVRLRSIVQKLRTEVGGGFIVRTSAKGRSSKELMSELRDLAGEWKNILANADRAVAPSLVHTDLGFTGRVVRDLVDKDVERIIIDSEQHQEKMIDRISQTLPSEKIKVENYKGRRSAFSQYGIEQELRKALDEKVWLKSGGHLVIEETEAMVSIDVNTGKYIGEGEKSVQETILHTNLEAVEEIVHQLRLRGIGGIIVIDFIDMGLYRHRQQVFNRLQQEIKKDRARTQILHISKMGLVEMTRQRTGPSLSRIMGERCPYCEGHGLVLSVETIAIKVLRSIKVATRKSKGKKFKVIANDLVVSHLLRNRQKLLNPLERQTRIRVKLDSDVDLHLEDFRILDDRGREIRTN